MVKDYLDDHGQDPAAIERLLGFLDERGLAVEAARIVGAHLEDNSGVHDSLGSEALQDLGMAHLDLGDDKRARSLLDTAVERSSTPAAAAETVAKRLFDADRAEMAVDYADKAVELDSERTYGRVYRGLAKLRLGELEAAREDLEASRESGMERAQFLQTAGIAALRTGRDDLAETYLQELASAPYAADFMPAAPFRHALLAFIEANAPKRGIAFLEEHYPWIAEGTGQISEEMLTTLSSLYEAAGRPERAYDVYRNAIARRLLSRESSYRGLPVYLNNLAYSYSTTGRHLDEGFELVRRALAMDSARSSSSIDTLGWLHYRRGDLESAEREIRRALRSSTADRTNLTELYEHLATILEARGEVGEAVWIRRFLKSTE